MVKSKKPSNVVDRTTNEQTGEVPGEILVSTTDLAQPSETALASPGVVRIQMISIESVQPNEYNPNVLTKNQLKEYTEEVQRLGRLPKPIIVRPVGETFMIVDGEHGFLAAKEAGFTMVPCEVVEVDDFEARRQTIMRNKHGTIDPVKQGRVFGEMMEDRNIGIRPLAKELNCSEGMIRNFLKFAEAAKVRKRYAGDVGHAEIAKLTVEQVRTYLDSPGHKRDQWLNQIIREATTPQKKTKKPKRKPNSPSAAAVQATEAIDERSPDPAQPLEETAYAQEEEDTNKPQALTALQTAWDKADLPTRHSFLDGLPKDEDAVQYLRKILEM